MDPASAIIGIVSFGFTVIGGLNKIRKAIKDAPEQVQALQDSSIAVSLLLSKIQVTGERALPSSPQASPSFESLCKRADICLKKVDETLKQVIAQSPSDGDGSDKHEIRLNWKRWFMDKGVLADLTGKLVDVRKVLCEMLEFLQVNYLEHIASGVDSVKQVQIYHSNCLEYIVDRMGSFEHAVNVIMFSTIQAGYSCVPYKIMINIRHIDHSRSSLSPGNTAGMIGDAQHNPCPSADLPAHKDHIPIELPSASFHTSRPPTGLRTHSPLQCPPKCKCRCHYPSIVRLIPECLASHFGQVTVTKRLFHPTFSSWSLCNVPNCRGNIHQAMTLQWFTPFKLLHAYFQYSKDHRIHFSIGAPRTVLWGSPIFKAIAYGDLQGVRDLFATGKASIWDYTIGGLPVFVNACEQWQGNPTEEHLEIVRLFVKAGAETLLFEETQRSSSAHDTLIGGFFMYLLRGISDESQSLATIVRTNTTAIQIFRSILNIDPMDALEDYLDCKQAQYTDVTGFMASLEDTRCNSESRSSVLQVTGYTPLLYAIYYSPESVESLLADGEDAAADLTLMYAVGN